MGVDFCLRMGVMCNQNSTVMACVHQGGLGRVPGVPFCRFSEGGREGGKAGQIAVRFFNSFMMWMTMTTLRLLCGSDGPGWRERGEEQNFWLGQVD